MDDDAQARFARLVLPHADAAYNLARWMTRNDQDAQDVVQEAMLRALRYFPSMRGDAARPWLLQIVRNTCCTWLEANRPAKTVGLDEHEDTWMQLPGPTSQEPQDIASRKADREHLNRALNSLPTAYREVLVLREMEDLSYKDIARIADIPVGTVMSRLARGREMLRRVLCGEARSPALALNGASRREGTDHV